MRRIGVGDNLIAMMKCVNNARVVVHCTFDPPTQHTTYLLYTPHVL